MKLSVFMIKYETDDSTWKVNLIAESREDALGYLKKEVGDKTTGYKITDLEHRDDIHALTTKVVGGIRGPAKEAEVVTETKLICPWCESEDYGTLHALKMHIVKTHTKKDKDKDK